MMRRTSRSQKWPWIIIQHPEGVPKPSQLRSVEWTYERQLRIFQKSVCITSGYANWSECGMFIVSLMLRRRLLTGIRVEGQHPL